MIYNPILSQYYPKCFIGKYVIDLLYLFRQVYKFMIRQYYLCISIIEQYNDIFSQ